jgi:hypothetical protein
MVASFYLLKFLEVGISKVRTNAATFFDHERITMILIWSRKTLCGTRMFEFYLI